MIQSKLQGYRTALNAEEAGSFFCLENVREDSWTRDTRHRSENWYHTEEKRTKGLDAAVLNPECKESPRLLPQWAQGCCQADPSHQEWKDSCGESEGRPKETITRIPQ